MAAAFCFVAIRCLFRLLRRFFGAQGGVAAPADPRTHPADADFGIAPEDGAFPRFLLIFNNSKSLVNEDIVMMMKLFLYL